MNKIRTQEDSDRFRLALVPVDQAFFASETKWGVGRLERLQQSAVLESYKRGWDAYRVALEEGDATAVEAIGPRMVQALAFMDQEATAAGHQPLAPDTWETSLPDGTVLVIVRSSAEAAAVIRAEKAATAYTARPGFGMTVVSDPAPTDPPSSETTLPPDLAVTVRNQHEGRRLEVWTLPEVARLIAAHGSVATEKGWEGTPAPSGRQMEENAAADLVRTGYPLKEPIAAGLDF